MFDPETFGAAVGALLLETVEPLKKRIAELETQGAGQQKKLDRLEQRSLSFKGAFQSSIDYESGSVVALNDKLFVATRVVNAGGQLREGSGWTLMRGGVLR